MSSMDANEQTILELRAALEREVTEAQMRAECDDPQLNEISRINNELVNAQRELASAAEAARQDAERCKGSEERYRRLFESAKDGILILDAETGKIEDVNPFLCHLLGFAPDDFIGKQLWEIGTLRDIAANQDALRTLQAKEYVRYDDLPLETKDGRSVSVEFVSNVYVSGVKQVIQCNIRDISGRKRTQTELEQMRRQYELFFNSVSEGIHGFDGQGRIIFENPASVKMLGYEARDLLGLPAHETIHHSRADGTGYPTCECPIYATLRDGIERNVDTEVFWRKDGTNFAVEYSSTAIRNEKGEIAGVVVSFRDITERKHAEESLRESEARKTAIFETALDCIISMDDTGRVLEFNPAAEKTFGYAREETIGQALADLIIPPALREQHNRGLAHFLATGEGPVLNSRIEVPAMRADGTELLVELAISPVNLGERTMFTAYLRDITERKQAEKDLRQSEAELEQAQRMSHLGSWEWDLTHSEDWSQNPVRWSSETFRLLGYEPGRDEASYENFVRVIHPDTHARMKTLADEALRDKTSYALDHALLLPDGTERIVHEQARFIYDESGKPIKMIGTVQDITERKQAESNLQRQAEELARSNDELARFNRFAVGRELRMVELKQQINRLSEQLGTPPPYKLAFVAESGLPEYDGGDEGNGDNGNN